jgi:hypothetical protein
LAGLALSGCDLFGDECADCQAAIDHMYEKVALYDCDAALMANAVQRIQDDCQGEDQNAGYIVQCVLENCSGGSLSQPLCASPGTGIGLDLSVVRGTDNPPDSGPGDVELVVQLLSAGGADKVRSYFLDEGSNEDLNDWIYDDGDAMTFQLFEPLTDVALTPLITRDLTVRSGTRLLDRGVRIGYVQSTNEYTVDFQFW